MSSKLKSTYEIHCKECGTPTFWEVSRRPIPIYKNGIKAERRRYKCPDCLVVTEVHKGVIEWRNLDIKYWCKPFDNLFKIRRSKAQKATNLQSKAWRRREKLKKQEAERRSKEVQEKIKAIEEKLKAQKKPDQ